MKMIKPEIPNEIASKWQENADLMATIIGVPTALIMKIFPLQVEVFIASSGLDNPYKKRQKFNLGTGIYCETVLTQRAQLLIPDARKDPHWAHSLDISLGMISYLGLPLMWPDGEMFGIISVLDRKENHYSSVYQKLIWQSKNAIDTDLSLLLKISEHKRAKEILGKLNEELELRIKERTLELKKVNEQLQIKIADSKRTEEKYRDLVEKEKDIIYTVDEEATTTWISPAVKTILSYKPDELIGKKFAALIPEEYQQKAKEDFDKLMEIGEIVAEIILLDKKGQRHMVEHSSTVIREDGKLVGARGIIRDITERKKVEEQLVASEAKYRNLFESSLEGVGISKGNRVVLANKVLLDIFGYESLKEFIKIPLIDHVAPEYRKMIWERIQKREKGEFVLPRYEFKIIRKNGKIRDLEISTSEILIENEKYVQSTFRDITERKMIEQLLRESEAKYSTLVEHAKDGVVIVQDEHIKFANRAMAEITGYSINELLGMHLLNMTLPECKEIIAQRYKLRLENKTLPAIHESKIKCKDGTKKDIEATGAVIQYHNKPAIVCIVRDITERKKAEVELLQAQKLASIGQLAAGVAHEINNPLSALSGEIQWLLKQSKDKKLVKSLQFMHKVSDRIVLIVKNLLTFSRETSIKVEEPSDINSLIEKTLLLIGRRLNASNIKIVKRLKKSLPSLTVNRGEIEQVFMNILMNSLDAMPHGGKLTISTSLSNDRKTIKIMFADTGCGMAKKILSRVFDPFFTTKPTGKGAGLGLYLSHSVVTKHNGNIRIDSELNKGTKVLLRIPLS